jgi:predicted O-methyltransferase YrrM
MPTDNKLENISHIYVKAKTKSKTKSIKSLKKQKSANNKSKKIVKKRDSNQSKSVRLNQNNIVRMKKEPIIIPNLPSSSQDMWTRQDIQVNDVLADVYKKGVLEKDGTTHKFKDTTNPIQGRHIYNLIKENKFTHTLEVGMAMGASTVWICQAHKDVGMNGNHIAIDPNQSTQYMGIGVDLVQRAGLSQYMELMEMPSYRAMPIVLEQVLNQGLPKFQLIYIDGWHTFDYTLVDFFFADLLLEVGGVIVLDDIKHIPVKKFFKYVATNYPHYKVVKKTPCYDPTDPKNSSQATFIKIANDTRTWNHHVEF